uniref:MRG domain-containing protein n=1 Tax=Macrostomum lignano TaxID=282301 RepID=A0A1I8J605_9PLAT
MDHFYMKLSVDVKDGHIKYFVHYQGWNKNWDEWVGDARIMKFNAVGLQKQKELKEFYSKPGKKVKGLRKSDLLNQEYPPPEALRRLEEAASNDGAASASSSSSQPPKQPPPKQQPPSKQLPPPPPLPPPAAAASTTSKRSARESLSSAVADPDASASESSGTGGAFGGGTGKRLRIQIELSRPLKLWLADDADLVCKQKRLLALPPPPSQTVSGILGRFVTTQSAISNADELERERLSEFVAGLQSYFNTVLNSQLLYSNERQQFSSLLKSHRTAMPASLYGCMHLLRLFVRLGDLLSHTKLDLKCLNTLLDYCDAFLLFLERNMDVFMTSGSYEPPDPRLASQQA